MYPCLMVIEYKRGTRTRKTYISLKKPVFQHGMLFFDNFGIIIQVSKGFYLKVRCYSRVVLLRCCVVTVNSQR